MRHALTIFAVTCLLLLTVGCGATNPPGQPGGQRDEGAGATLPTLGAAALRAGERLRVVATTSIVGDVVAQVGGAEIELITLMAPGEEPHAFQLSAQDLAKSGDAHVIFVNGFALEAGLLETLEGASAAPLVSLSAGIQPLAGGEPEQSDALDPHVWFEVRNVERWSDNAAEVLAQLDPAHAEGFRRRAAAYKEELSALDDEVRATVGTIPAERRKLVTNHDTFRYFARAYGFEVIGTVLPGASTGEDPSAADVGALIEAIKGAGVRAIFIENTVGEGLARVVSEETGAQVYELYTDALGPVGSGADSYLGMMRANLATLRAALGPG